MVGDVITVTTHPQVLKRLAEKINKLAPNPLCFLCISSIKKQLILMRRTKLSACKVYQ